MRRYTMRTKHMYEERKPDPILKPLHVPKKKFTRKEKRKILDEAEQHSAKIAALKAGIPIQYIYNWRYEIKKASKFKASKTVSTLEHKVQQNSINNGALFEYFRKLNASNKSLEQHQKSFHKLVYVLFSVIIMLEVLNILSWWQK